MATARQVIIGGGGIGGLSAALSIARIGMSVDVLEQARQIEQAGAGIQLSPNATRILYELGLGERLKHSAVFPEAIRVMNAGNGKEIVRIPLGRVAEARYGAPFLVMHRADLHGVLLEAASASADISVSLGTRIEDYVTHANGVTVQTRQFGQIGEQKCNVLIGADGLWSAVRGRMRRESAPIFRHRTAWRALVPAADVSAQWRQPLIHLWLGRETHLVHYPVKGGALINIVAIADDEWQATTWNAPSDRNDVLQRFSRWDWAENARHLLSTPEQWAKWALHDRRVAHRGRGTVALLGDASHPMLPFLAQGAAMAIEDGAVLASHLAQHPDRPNKALRGYEKERRKRTQKTQKAARKQGSLYGKFGPEGAIRNLVMRWRGGEKLLSRYDWLYKWRPPVAKPIPSPRENSTPRCSR